MELIKYSIGISMVVHWFSCALGMQAQLMAPERSDELALAVQYQMDHCPFDLQAASFGTECYGCLPGGSLEDDSICRSPCLTACEIFEQAKLELNSTDGCGQNTYSVDFDTRVALLNNWQNWVCRYTRDGLLRPPEFHGELWVAGLYVAMIQMGGGVGSIVPQNFPEYLLFFLCIVIGSVLWAMVVGTICATLATGDPHTIAFKQNMDSLNYFLDDMNMPQELRIRAREYLRNCRDLYKKSSYSELVERLSPDLRSEVVLTMSSKILEVVWYFKPIEKTALVELAVRLQRAGYAPREKIQGSKLNILMRGVAAKAGNILTPVSTAVGVENAGNCLWGEDVIITAPALRDQRPASALTYVEVATLERKDIDDVLHDFPQSRRLVQQAAMKIAMQRAVIVVSEYIKMKQRPASSDAFFANIQMPSASEHNGAEILQMLTGQTIRGLDTDEAPTSVPSSPVKGGAEDVNTETLAADVREMKKQLEAISKMLKEKA